MEHRPWGSYQILGEAEDHKIKRIIVHPGQRLSLQRHQKRSEYWLFLKGEAIVTLDEIEHKMHKNMHIDIPVGSWHRIQNIGNENVIFIEVQTGTYFGEDDIERLEDDYGRIT